MRWGGTEWDMVCVGVASSLMMTMGEGSLPRVEVMLSIASHIYEDVKVITNL